MGTTASTTSDSTASSTSSNSNPVLEERSLLDPHPHSLMSQMASMAQQPPLPTYRTPTKNPAEYSRSPGSDGYKWRKYGQKNVKGMDYPRSYYKCTAPGCGVKKYVELMERDGKIVENVTYKGEHLHDPSKISRMNPADNLGVVGVEQAEQQATESNIALALTSSESLSQGIQSEYEAPHIGNGITRQDNATIPPQPQPLPRVVVETEADVDAYEDGYKWRKYGQKLVKGSPNPRSYYRCSEEGCGVKKHTERRDSKLVTTYDGVHTHPAPSLTSDIHKQKKRKKSARSSEDVLTASAEASLEDLKRRVAAQSDEEILMNLRQSNQDVLTNLNSSQDANGFVVGIPLQEIPIEYNLSQSQSQSTTDVHPLASSQEPTVTAITQNDSEQQESQT